MSGPLAELARRFEAAVGEASRRARASGESVMATGAARTEPRDPVAVFAGDRSTCRWLWQQPSRASGLVGVGAADRLVGRGRQRLARLRRSWGDLLATAVLRSGDDCPLALPLAVGGLAFDPERSADPAWRLFPDAELVVPELLLHVEADRAWVALSAEVGPADEPAELAAAAARRAAILAARNGLPGAPCGRSRPTAAPPPSPHWHRAVARVLAAIEERRLEKVVVARRARVERSGRFRPEVALLRLREEYPECTVFAVGRGAACFVGATPERLARLDGGTVEADCVAGSRRRGGTPEEDAAEAAALLLDPKERHEHQLVVRGVASRLAPLCGRLSAPAEPGLLRVANLHHLVTPFEGEAAPGVTLLDLVERLHPTAATGGLPVDRALALIRAVEPFDRGWYSGVVMWLDAGGGGEGVVAIRSALVADNEALLYAGCGIVAGSDPEREYAETCLKMEPMQWALEIR